MVSGDDMDDKEYWENYYKKNRNPVDASTFARFSLGFLEKDKKLIEFGCGNGRDSVYFATEGLNVLAIDQVEDELNYLNERYSGLENLLFKSADFTNLDDSEKFDYVYSRFTLHSIPEEREKKVFEWIKNQLNDDGLFLLEVRSINDPMFNRGEKISDHENITTHYRRYLDIGETIEKIRNIGLEIVYQLEDNDLSVYGDDNPVLIRIVARK